MSIERILVTNQNNEMVFQFHIHPTDDGKLRLSDVVFTQNHFTMSHVVYDRIVLGILTGSHDISHVCLVFADQTHAEEVFDSISSHYNKKIIFQQAKANVLFSTALADVTDFY